MKIWMMAALAAASMPVFAQQGGNNAGKMDIKGWHLKSSADSFNGINLNAAYAQLKGRKPVPLIVAVIDSGVDTAHEDLKKVLWRNPKEIPGNGIDDDKNGYVDDVYGWNFLGGKDGRNVNKASAEKVRVYHRFKKKYENPNFDSTRLTKDEKWEYAMWKRAAEETVVTKEAKNEVMMLSNLSRSLHRVDSTLRSQLGRDTFTVNGLASFNPTDADGKKAKSTFLAMMRNFGQDGSAGNGFIKELDEYLEGKADAVAGRDVEPEDYRKTVIKDNYWDFNDRYYGNPDVMAGTPTHGTHVSGIIGASRSNGVGMDGVADNVRIMTVRAVPNGDEYDKDVALAIRYAVDNGAKVINMSFGKGYSPEKKWVDEAFQYAASKDVLIVHAAGNDSKNVDSSENYPSADLYTIGKKATNVITVGASSSPEVDGKMLAGFSNYGKANVDVFAPGVRIYSTLPGGNAYGALDGTSMASPVVAGVASLIRSYYPKLSATQVKQAIEQSVRKMDTPVNMPGEENEVMLSDLSRTGGEVDAGAAIALAAKMSASPVKTMPAAQPGKKVIPPVKKTNVRS